MKILLDFFPVVAFFVAYYIPDDLEQRMYIATIAAIIAGIIQVTVNWLLHKRIEKMHVIEPEKNNGNI
ncbi:MAG: septation protein IspZ [Gammaproteobacteria bacterium]|jgi:intracellular septation protein